MRDVKTRAAMEQPKTRQKDAIPRTAVRILQRHYAQQKQERQHQRQPVEYATEQAQQGAADAARLTFHATQQLRRKYALHKYRAQKVRQRQETTAAQVRQRDMWQSTEQTAAAQSTTAAETPRIATAPHQPARKQPAPTMTTAQQRAKQQTQRAAQRRMLQQTKAAARKAGQRLEQMAQAAGKVVRAGIEAIAAAGGGVVLFLLLALPVVAVAAALSPAGVLADSHTMEPTGEAMEVWERLPDDLRRCGDVFKRKLRNGVHGPSRPVPAALAQPILLDGVHASSHTHILEHFSFGMRFMAKVPVPEKASRGSARKAAGKGGAPHRRFWGRTGKACGPLPSETLSLSAPVFHLKHCVPPPSAPCRPRRRRPPRTGRKSR